MMRLAVVVPPHEGPTSRKEREKWGTPIVLIAGDVGHPPIHRNPSTLNAAGNLCDFDRESGLP